MTAGASHWLFDLGNSRLKCAPLRGDGRLAEVVAIDHDGVDFAARWDGVLPARIEAATIASVASTPLRTRLLDALCARCGRITLATTQARFGGLEIAYAQPQGLGVDRFLALLAAHARGAGTGSVVVGVGTALTIDWIDGTGRHHGGRIAPSPALMRDALHARASQLPETGGGYAEFADNTRDALASGCTGAALALVERSVEQVRRRAGVAPNLLLHGGGHDALRPYLQDATAAPTLVLEGLALWSRTLSGV